MLLFVTLASESKLSIRDLLGCYNHCNGLSGSGRIAMDFIMSLLRTQSSYDSIWVIVN
jgi:hypothetical protein